MRRLRETRPSTRSHCEIGVLRSISGTSRRTEGGRHPDVKFESPDHLPSAAGPDQEPCLADRRARPRGVRGRVPAGDRIERRAGSDDDPGPGSVPGDDAQRTAPAASAAGLCPAATATATATASATSSATTAADHDRASAAARAGAAPACGSAHPEARVRASRSGDHPS